MPYFSMEHAVGLNETHAIRFSKLAYPEGVERLIGQGWREATTLSNGSFEDY